MCTVTKKSVVENFSDATKNIFFAPCTFHLFYVLQTCYNIKVKTRQDSPSSPSHWLSMFPFCTLHHSHEFTRCNRLYFVPRVSMKCRFWNIDSNYLKLFLAPVENVIDFFFNRSSEHKGKKKFAAIFILTLLQYLSWLCDHLKID